MALTVTSPAEITAAYNPIIVSAVSDVRDDLTIGANKPFDEISNGGGYVQITFLLGAHGLLKGDFISIKTAPGAEYLIGVWLVTKIVDSETIVINLKYNGTPSDTCSSYKYLNNYNALLLFYVYQKSSPSTAIKAASKTYKPRFKNGFCYFEADMQDLVKAFNYELYSAAEVLSSDLYILPGNDVQDNTRSFVKWGFEMFEGFDNPVGGVPQYQDEIIATD